MAAKGAGTWRAGQLWLLAASVVVTAAACGRDGAAPPGEDRICRDGLRLALAATPAPTSGPTATVVVVSDDEIVAEVPRGERGVTFDSFLWAPDGTAIALFHSFRFPAESGLLDPSCQPFDAVAVPGSVISWSPGGNQLLLSRAVDMDGRRRVEYGVATVTAGLAGTPDLLSSFDLGPAGAGAAPAIEAVWSPDSSAVAFAVFTDEEVADALPGHLYLVSTRVAVPEPVEVGAIARTHAFAWSPDGAAIAFIDGDPGVNLIEMTGAEVRRVDADREVCPFDDSPDEVPLIWSPDGSAFLYPARLAAEDDCVLRQVALDGGEAGIETRTLVDSGNTMRPAWFRDSRHVVHPSGDGASLLWTDPETFTSTPIAAAVGDATLIRFGFAPTYRRVAVLRGVTGDLDAALLVAETAGAEPGPASEVTRVDSVGTIKWSPSGEQIAITGAPGAYIALPDQVEEMSAREAAWSPDSRHLVLEQDRAAIVYRPEGGALGDGRLIAEESRGFAWAPLAP